MSTLDPRVHVPTKTLLVVLIPVLVVAVAQSRLTAGGAPAPLVATDAWAGEPIGDIDRRVFGLALTAATCAIRSGDVTDLQTLTVIDYSRPATRKRLWVFDLRKRNLVYEELVAHGSGSGMDVATSFSNTPETHQSSLGLFRTEGSYMGGARATPCDFKAWTTASTTEPTNAPS